MSLWCLLAAPLLIGCDLTKLDDWTLTLLTNDEALAVNQDPLGRQASRIFRDQTSEVWARPLSDGSTAMGLFNRFKGAAQIRVGWEQLGINGPKKIRDLWRHEDLGTFDREFAADVAGHGVVLVTVR